MNIKIWIITILTIYTNFVYSEEFKPPFNTKWGQSPENIVKWAEENKFTMTWVENPNVKDTVLNLTYNNENILNKKYHKISFYFLDNSLIEVSIHYKNKNNVKAINDYITIAKETLFKNYGKGILIVNKNEDNIETKITQWEIGENKFIRFSSIKTMKAFNNNFYGTYIISYRNEPLK